MAEIATLLREPRPRRRGAGALERRTPAGCAPARRWWRAGSIPARWATRCAARAPTSSTRTTSTRCSGSRALGAARRGGRGGRDAPPQLPPVLRDRHRLPGRRVSAPAAAGATCFPACGCGAAAACPRRPAYGAGLWRQQPRILEAVGTLRRAERLRGGPAGGAGAAARADLGRTQLPAAPRSSPTRRRRRSPSTRCSPAGWWRRRESRPRSRRPRAPACRWPSRGAGPRRRRSGRRRACSGSSIPTGMRAALRRAAFVVAPSRWDEPCPYSVIEAMAAGVPGAGVRAGRAAGDGRRVEHASRPRRARRGRRRCRSCGPTASCAAPAPPRRWRARATCSARALLRCADGCVRGGAG